MINYYEVLEVSENASKEVIEKAYKVLTKKYHPDLNPENKKEYESKMKEINEAYGVLIDDKKRENFDSVLQKYKTINAQKSTVLTQTEDNSLDEKTKRKLKKKMQERYLEAYDNYLREHGYKLVYKWTFKRIMTVVLAIAISILIFALLFLIPPIRSYFISLYNSNVVIKLFVDIFIALFSAIWKTISSIFT